METRAPTRPMSVGRRASTALGVITMVGMALACSDASGPKGQANVAASPFIVSNPRTAVGAAGSSTSAGNVLASERTTIYVALPPGSIPNADQVVIRVRPGGVTVTAAAVDGGFDPVAITAGQGDTLDIEVRLTGNPTPLLFSMAVPGAARPIVVRTSPPPRKRDVPLNMTILVVFSEPIAAPSLNNASVQLINGTTSVEGQLAFGDPAHVTATFMPTVPLVGGTDYTLTITQAIQDLDGQALAAPLVVPFTTTAPVPVASVDVSLLPPSIVVGASVVLTAQPKDAAGNALIGRSLVWRSSTPNVAAVSQSGVVQGISPGVATISATSEGVTGGVLVTVIPAASGVSQIAVGRCVDDRCGIFVVGADGSNGRFVTETDGGDPTWSPDGKQIAVSSGRDCVPGAAERCYLSIYVMNADGSEPRRLPDRPSTDSYTPAWSPDGRRIAFGAAEYDAADRFVRQDLYVMNVDGSGSTLLVPGTAEVMVGLPKWSPDGTSISYTSWRNDTSAIYVVGVNGSRPVRLSAPSASNGDSWASWSPDGKKIAFARHWFRPVGSSEGDRCQVFVMNADGSNPTQLTNDSFCATDPSWSPDGTRIALLANFGLGLGLSIMNADGSGGVTVVRDGGFSSPAWSPTGTVPAPSTQRSPRP